MISFFKNNLAEKKLDVSKLLQALLLSTVVFAFFFLFIAITTESFHGIFRSGALFVWLSLTLYFYLSSNKTAHSLFFAVLFLILSPLPFYFTWHFTERTIANSLYSATLLSTLISAILLFPSPPPREFSSLSLNILLWLLWQRS